MNFQEKLQYCTGCESLYTEISYVDGHRTGIVNCAMTPVFEGKQ